MEGLERLKKVLKTLLLVTFVGACVYFVEIYKVATKDIGSFEEKTLLYDQQNEKFFIEHQGSNVMIETVKDTFYIDVQMVPDMKVYCFEHNVENNGLFKSGLEVFSGEYTHEELRHFVLRYKKTELFANCFISGLLSFIAYFIVTFLYLVIKKKV